jgi:uncharacterized protein YjbI with pentapeptide repeats
MLAKASLHGASLGGNLRLTDASLRGASLSGTLLLADARLRGISLSGTLLLVDFSHIFGSMGHKMARAKSDTTTASGLLLMLSD